ncbi:MAG: lysophospholipid acyltransferase family protein [Verrucomicrobiales bacterium]
MRSLLTALRRCRDLVAGAVGFLYFGLGGLAITLIGAIAHLAVPQSYRTGRRAVGAAFRSFLTLLRHTGIATFDVSPLDTLRHERGIIIAPNHPTLLDAVLVIARVPEAVCILKAPLLDSPFLGGARWANYLRNDAGAGMVRQGVAELAGGGKLLIFPEGTRSLLDQGPLNPFKGGFALIAREAAAPVQTIFLEVDPPYLGKNLPWYKMPGWPMAIRARLGQRFNPPAKHEDVKVWVRQLEDYFREERASHGNVKTTAGLQRAET